jgi:hypothetical protein
LRRLRRKSCERRTPCRGEVGRRCSSVDVGRGVEGEERAAGNEGGVKGGSGGSLSNDGRRLTRGREGGRRCESGRLGQVRRSGGRERRVLRARRIWRSDGSSRIEMSFGAEV